MSRTAYRWQVKTKPAVTFAEFLETARQQLRVVSERPLSDAQALLAFYLSRQRAAIIAHPEETLTAEQHQHLLGWVNRLAAGEPMAYIVGQWEFYGRCFQVTRDVLIPRPETELLIEQALGWLRANPRAKTVADVGTGSGCIAVTLQLEKPALAICAVDRSFAALRVAGQNANRLGANTTAFIQADLLSAFQGPFNLVCANLPYIPTKTAAALPVSRFEPLLALDGGPDGLSLVRCLLADAPRWMHPGGCMLLEVEAGHGELAPAAARSLLPTADVQIISDYAGLPRLLKIQFPG